MEWELKLEESTLYHRSYWWIYHKPCKYRLVIKTKCSRCSKSIPNDLIIKRDFLNQIEKRAYPLISI